MRVALTIFGSTISPLFDAAQRMLLVDIEAGEVHRRLEVSIGDLDPAERLWVLTYHKVNVLICGGISSFMHQAFQERGVRVYPWIAGEWEEVLLCLALRFTPWGQQDRSRRVAVAADGSGASAQVAWSLRGCTHFLLFDGSGERLEVIGHHDHSTFAHSGCCAVARMLIDGKVKVLLARRCGPNALGMLAAAGIEAVQGAEGEAASAVRSYLRGDLTPELQGDTGQPRLPPGGAQGCATGREGRASGPGGRGRGQGGKLRRKT